MILRLKFWCVGVSALLCHNPAGMSGGSGPRMRKIPTPEEEAKTGCYRLEDDTFGHPANAFTAAIVQGAVGKKIGRGAAWKVFASAVWPPDDIELVQLVHPKTKEPLTEYVIDRRRVRLGQNAVLRARPKFKPWACMAEMILDDDYFTPEQVLEQLRDSGRRMGVGDYRPFCKGPFGKFVPELVSAKPQDDA